MLEVTVQLTYEEYGSVRLLILVLQLLWRSATCRGALGSKLQVATGAGARLKCCRSADGSPGSVVDVSDSVFECIKTWLQNASRRLAFNCMHSKRMVQQS